MSWINRLLMKKNKSETTPGVPEIPLLKAENLLHLLDKTQEKELCCEDVHSLLEAFAEMTARGEDTRQIMPQVHLHMELCPDCQEEFEALLCILKAAAETP
jgi:hypothetical protein